MRYYFLCLWDMVFRFLAFPARIFFSPARKLYCDISRSIFQRSLFLYECFQLVFAPIIVIISTILYASIFNLIAHFQILPFDQVAFKNPIPHLYQAFLITYGIGIFTTLLLAAGYSDRTTVMYRHSVYTFFCYFILPFAIIAVFEQNRSDGSLYALATIITMWLLPISSAGLFGYKGLNIDIVRKELEISKNAITQFESEEKKRLKEGVLIYNGEVVGHTDRYGHHHNDKAKEITEKMVGELLAKWHDGEYLERYQNLSRSLIGFFVFLIQCVALVLIADMIYRLR